jgi:hypothetical protein
MKYLISDPELLKLLNTAESSFYGNISNDHKMIFEMIDGMNLLSCFKFIQGEYPKCFYVGEEHFAHTDDKYYFETCGKDNVSENLKNALTQLHIYTRTHIRQYSRHFDETDFFSDSGKQDFSKNNGKWIYDCEERLDSVLEKLITNDYLSTFDLLTLENRNDHIVFFDGDDSVNCTIGVKCDNQKFITKGKNFKDASNVLLILKHIFNIISSNDIAFKNAKTNYTIHITQNDFVVEFQ